MGRDAGKLVKPRSRQACKKCHDRRVRCDALTRGVPCSRCSASNQGDSCQLLESRKIRGEDGRFSGRAVEIHPGATPRPARTVEGSLDNFTRRPSSSAALITADTPRRDQGNPCARPSSTAMDDIDEPEVVRRPAFEADQWSKIISREVASVPDGRRVTYVGESWNLYYMIQWKSQATPHEAADPTLQHHNSPSEADAESPCFHIPVPLQQDTPSPRAARSSNYHRKDQVPPAIQSALIDAYFAHHAIHYPVIAESDFRSSMATDNVSPLLLSAVLYVGGIHVSDSIIHRAGFDTRQACLRKLYTRSKAVFFEEESDVDVSDQLSRVQAAFLLHHMWLSPNSVMDCWTWLTLAIRLAQNMGMHRSTSRSSLKQEDRKLWKRIWWSLHTRDAQIASGVGKPLIINDLDCDVERLAYSDFETNFPPEARLFVIEQAKLADICKQVMCTRFTPGLKDEAEDEKSKAELMSGLKSWNQSLPERLRYHPDCDPTRVTFQALLVEVLYNNMLLLIHRPRIMPSNQQAAVRNDNASWNIVFHAASMVTDITGLIMNYKSVYHCPLFYTSALFGAMTMHVIRGPPAEHQLGLCMIAMRTLANMYSNAEWVRNIFQKLGGASKKLITYNPSASSTRQPSPSPSRVTDRQTPMPGEFSIPLSAVHQPTQQTNASGQSSSMAPLGHPTGFSPRDSNVGSDRPQTSWHGQDSVDMPMVDRFAVGHSNDMFPPNQFPMLDQGGNGYLDSDLAHCWRNLFCAESPFHNPFIINGMSDS